LGVRGRFTKIDSTFGLVARHFGILSPATPPFMDETFFADLDLSEDVLEAIKDMGFEQATPIQAQAIPVALDQKDLIGLAQTGTGKTAAFGIPVVEMTDPALNNVQSLIMCPTRELAIQVADEIQKIAKHRKGLKMAIVFGGDSMEKQVRALKGGAQIIVGTPGRIMDHMDRGNIDLGDVRFVVLDEADTMLDMGFREDMETILRTTPTDRQTMLFSATMSREIQEISRSFLVDPVVVEIERKELTADTIDQSLFILHEDRKIDAFCALMWYHNFKTVLIFCNTKRKVDELVEHLNGRGFVVEGLHGDMRQGARNQVMNKVRKGSSTILIATDVAARGLDVESIEAVFNFDLPMDVESYVHRIGRTGRAGRTGHAFAFATSRQTGLIKQIERYARTTIPKAELPTYDNILQKGRENLVTQLVEVTEGEEFPELNDLLQQLEERGVDAVHGLKAALWIQLQEREDRMSKFVRNISVPKTRTERGDDGAPNPNAERRERPASADRGLTPEGRVKLWMDIGKKGNARVNDIVGSVAGESGIPGKDIFPVKVLDYNSWFEVPDTWADTIIEALQGKVVRGKEVQVTFNEKTFDRDSAPRTSSYGGGGGSFGANRGGGGSSYGGNRGGGSFGGSRGGAPRSGEQPARGFGDDAFRGTNAPSPADRGQRSFGRSKPSGGNRGGGTGGGYQY
jgi:ATP-dependent RNA helicase DeaD